MRRFVVLTLLAGVAAAGVGCQRAHVAGMSDVYHHPDNAVINTGHGNPYRPTGGPIYNAAVPEKMPAPLPGDAPKQEK